MSKLHSHIKNNAIIIIFIGLLALLVLEDLRMSIFNQI